MTKMNRKSKRYQRSNLLGLQLFQPFHHLFRIFIRVSGARNCQMFVSDFSVVVKFPIDHFLEWHCRKPYNCVGPFVFVFQTVFELLVEVRHGFPESWSIDPSWMHGDKLAMAWIYFGELLSHTNLLSFVSCVLCSSIELIFVHVNIIGN